MPRSSRSPAVFLLAVAMASGCSGAVPDAGEDPPLVVFAAASLRDVGRELAAAFERRHPYKIVLNFAGSDILAQQIRAAPGADLFLSADEEWVAFLDRAGRTVPGSRQVLFSNRLVLIARRNSPWALADPRELAEADFRSLALADPKSVPAGRYARAYLEAIPWGDGTVWSAVADQVVPALDVRAALALVESDPEILGIVYRTDALASSRIRVLYEFPPRDEMPIHYWATLIADAQNAQGGREFLEFLASPQAREIVRRFGFVVPEP